MTLSLLGNHATDGDDYSDHRGKNQNRQHRMRAINSLWLSGFRSCVHIFLLFEQPNSSRGCFSVCNDLYLKRKQESNNIFLSGNFERIFVLATQLFNIAISLIAPQSYGGTGFLIQISRRTVRKLSAENLRESSLPLALGPPDGRRDAGAFFEFRG